MAGARRDADQLDRVLPGHVPVRRQPVSVLGPGAGRGAGAVRVVLRRDDRRAAVLRALPEGAAHARPTGRAAQGLDGGRFNRGFSAAFERMLDRGTSGASARALRAPGRVVAGITALFVAQPAVLSAARRRVLPADRRRPVRDERQGAVGHAASRSPPQEVEPGRGARAPHRRAGRSRSDRLEHRRAARLLVDLHQQLGAAHGDRAGRAQGRAPHRQLRVHGPGAARPSRRSCRT